MIDIFILSALSPNSLDINGKMLLRGTEKSYIHFSVFATVVLYKNERNEIISIRKDSYSKLNLFRIFLRYIRTSQMDQEQN